MTSLFKLKTTGTKKENNQVSKGKMSSSAIGGLSIVELVTTIERLCNERLNEISRPLLLDLLEELNKRERTNDVDVLLVEQCKRHQVCFTCLVDTNADSRCVQCSYPLCKTCHDGIMSTNRCTPRLTWQSIELAAPPATSDLVPKMVMISKKPNVIMAAVHKRIILKNAIGSMPIQHMESFWHPQVAQPGISPEVRLSMLAMLRSDFKAIITKWNEVSIWNTDSTFDRAALGADIIHNMTMWLMGRNRMVDISYDKSKYWVLVHNEWPRTDETDCRLNEVVGRYTFDRDRFTRRIAENYNRVLSWLDDGPTDTEGEDEEDEDDEDEGDEDYEDDEDMD